MTYHFSLRRKKKYNENPKKLSKYNVSISNQSPRKKPSRIQLFHTYLNSIFFFSLQHYWSLLKVFMWLLFSISRKKTVWCKLKIMERIFFKRGRKRKRRNDWVIEKTSNYYLLLCIYSMYHIWGISCALHYT